VFECMCLYLCGNEKLGWQRQMAVSDWCILMTSTGPPLQQHGAYFTLEWTFYAPYCPLAVWQWAYAATSMF